MKPQTEAALRGLLAMDDEIAPEALEKAHPLVRRFAVAFGQVPFEAELLRCIFALLRGDRDSSDLIHVLKFKEVMSLLHIHRRTLEYYLARGYLTRVYGNAPKSEARREGRRRRSRSDAQAPARPPRTPVATLLRKARPVGSGDNSASPATASSASRRGAWRSGRDEGWGMRDEG